jgi:two-component system, sensor histidine kinase and response regulator
VILPNGETRWMLTTKVPWRDASGKIIGLVGIGRNVTDQRKAEIKLKDERNLLRTVIDNLPDGIYAKDTEARKVMANPANFKNWVASPKPKSSAKPISTFFQRKSPTRFLRTTSLFSRMEKPVINREEKIVLKNGETRWQLTSKIPWRDASGKIIGLVGIGRDITDKKPSRSRSCARGAWKASGGWRPAWRTTSTTFSRRFSFPSSYCARNFRTRIA